MNEPQMDTDEGEVIRQECKVQEAKWRKIASGFALAMTWEVCRGGT